MAWSCWAVLLNAAAAAVSPAFPEVALAACTAALPLLRIVNTCCPTAATDTVLVVVAGAVDHAAHVNHTVVYTVTGTGTASVVIYGTFQKGNGQNGEAQLTNVPLPWS